jgi:hypothetical protein
LTEAGSTTPTRTSTQRWMWIGIASAVQMVAALSLIAAAELATTDAGRDAAVASAVGLILVPVVFLIAAFGTGRTDPGFAVFKALGVFIAVTLAGGLVTPVIGIGLAFAFGGMLVISPDGEFVTRARFIAVGILALYLLVLLVVSPPAAIFGVAVLPLFSVALADTMVGWVRSNDRR